MLWYVVLNEQVAVVSIENADTSFIRESQLSERKIAVVSWVGLREDENELLKRVDSQSWESKMIEVFSHC